MICLTKQRESAVPEGVRAHRKHGFPSKRGKDRLSIHASENGLSGFTCYFLILFSNFKSFGRGVEVPVK